MQQTTNYRVGSRDMNLHLTLNRLLLSQNKD